MLSGNLNVYHDRYLTKYNCKTSEVIEKSLPRISTDIVEFRLLPLSKMDVGALDNTLSEIEEIIPVYKSESKSFGVLLDLDCVPDFDKISKVFNKKLDVAINISKHLNTKALSSSDFMNKLASLDVCVVRQYSDFANPQSIIEDIKITNPHRISYPYGALYDINFIRYLAKNKIVIEVCPTDLYKKILVSSSRGLSSILDKIRAEGVHIVIKNDNEYISNISDNLQYEYEGLLIDSVDVTNYTFIDKKIQKFKIH